MKYLAIILFGCLSFTVSAQLQPLPTLSNSGAISSADTTSGLKILTATNASLTYKDKASYLVDTVTFNSKSLTLAQLAIKLGISDTTTNYKVLTRIIANALYKDVPSYVSDTTGNYLKYRLNLVTYVDSANFNSKTLTLAQLATKLNVSDSITFRTYSNALYQNRAAYLVDTVTFESKTLATAQLATKLNVADSITIRTYNNALYQNKALYLLDTVKFVNKATYLIDTATMLAKKDTFKLATGIRASIPLYVTPTVQTINTTSTVTAWNSTILIGAVPLTANIVITLPTVVGNTTKTITLIRLDNAPFTVSVVGNGADILTLQSTGTELNILNGSITIQAVDATNARQIMNIGSAPPASVNGSSYFTGTLTIPATSTSIINAATVLSINIPSAGIYSFGTTVCGFINANNITGSILSGLYDASGTLVPNSELGIVQIVGSATSGFLIITGTNTIIANVPAAGNYTLRVWNLQANTTFAVTSSVQGRTGVTYNKIGGFIPTVGSTVDYAYGKPTTSSTLTSGAAQDIPFSLLTPSSLLSSGGGVILLAGKTYRLFCQMDFTNPSVANTFTEYQWVDASNNPLPNVSVGEASPVNSTNTHSNAGSFVIYTPIINTTVHIRTTAITTNNVITNTSSFLEISQLGTTALAGGSVWLLAGNTATNSSILGSTDNSNVNIQSGTGSLNVSNDATTTTVNVGTGAAAKTLNLGSTSLTSSTIIQSGTGQIGLVANGGAITMASLGGTVNISNDAVNNTVNVGTGAAVKVVTVGSLNTTSSTFINSGVAGIVLAPATATGNGVSVNNSLQTSGNVFNIAAISAAKSNNSNASNISSSGALAVANITTIAENISNTNTGTTNTNVALQVSATGGTNNYALLVPNGNTGIGTATPTSTFQVAGSQGESFVNTTAATYTATATDRTIYLSLVGTQSLVLPTASTCPGRKYLIINASDYQKTISTYTTINGNSVTIFPKENFELISDGSVFRRLSTRVTQIESKMFSNNFYNSSSVFCGGLEFAMNAGTTGANTLLTARTVGNPATRTTTANITKYVGGQYSTGEAPSPGLLNTFTAINSASTAITSAYVKCDFFLNDRLTGETWIIYLVGDGSLNLSMRIVYNAG